jgi:PhnB protein
MASEAPKKALEGCHTITPYMCIKDAAKALDFYKTAFGAEELSRDADPDGRIRHAEFRIGDSKVMMCDEFPEFGMMRSLQAVGESPVSIFLWVEDTDVFFDRAVKSGATSIMPVEDKPYGRSGGLKDPFGLIWWVSS